MEHKKEKRTAFSSQVPNAALPERGEGRKEKGISKNSTRERRKRKKKQAKLSEYNVSRGPLSEGREKGRAN